MISPMVGGLSEKLDVHPTLVTLGFVGLAMVGTKLSKPKVNAFKCGVENETWVDYIIQRFWKDNAFMQFVYNESAKVLAGKVVHIPQPGAKPSAVKNRNVFPAVAVRRTDTDVVYPLDEYSVDPVHIHNRDKMELTYDALDEAYGDQAGVVNEIVAEDLLVKWLTGLPAASIVRTTGANVDAHVASATGQRKSTVHANLKAAGKVMNLQGVPKTDRYVLFDEEMYDQFTNSLSDTQERDFSKYFDATTGVVGRLHGFSIMTRASVAAASNADVIRALGAAGAATDNGVAICWQKQCLALAIGDVEMFDDMGNPLYYGDIVSSTQRMGGRRRRGDDRGVVAIIQAPSA